jgi:hypothetical protein
VAPTDARTGSRPRSAAPADDFANVAAAQAGDQHPPVDEGVPARHALGQHMGPLEMPEGGLEVILPQRLVGPLHFLFVGLVHVGAPGWRERDLRSL